ncbi:peptidoglycan -binding protein [Geminicoccaceae bacterium 1502E]|nr:peptidoglycan -binding protein [Geminicoccaceae bacterium 1502E]
MNQAAADRDEALEFLEKQVEAAAGALGTTGQTADSLRDRAAVLGDELDQVRRDRAALTDRLETVEDERSRRLGELEQRLARLDETLAGERESRAAVEQTLAERETALSKREAALAAARERLAVLEKQGAAAEQRGAGLTAELEESRREVARLTGLLTLTVEQLRGAGTALEASRERVQSQETTIAELGRRLDEALAEKLEELSRYRSEFFGRLRQVLGERPDIRVVGDRFVFQSELLFGSGSATLDPAGRKELAALARTLNEVAADIPDDVDWILRVDGHTDRVPIRDRAAFQSNWDLSTQRAIAVVEFLVRQGIPPGRLAATGFGEYKPLDPGEDEIAYRRNRRIEFKLTEG